MKDYLPVLFALATALCWGLYGPILGRARVADTSPFKPYVAIGVAYLVIAILGGLIGMWFQGDTFEVGAGGRWGVIAGPRALARSPSPAMFSRLASTP
jgi:hypothetical protein